MKTCLIAALLGALLLASPLRAAEAPVAPKEPKDVSVHGDRRIDDYFWLRNRDDPRVLEYLKAENAHTAAWLAPRSAFRDKLYDEMLARIRQDDDSVPYRNGRWWYATRTPSPRAPGWVGVTLRLPKVWMPWDRALQ